MTDISTELLKLTEVAMTHATVSLLTEPGALLPFVLEEKNGDRGLHRFGAERLEEMLEQARYYLAEVSEADRAVLFWDGYLPTTSGRTDALYFESADRDAEHSFVAARPYRTRGMLRKSKEFTGDLVLVRHGALFT